VGLEDSAPPYNWVALNFFAYNFIFRHRTLRMPPALRAGVTNRWWTYEELVEMIDGAGTEGATRT